MQALSVPRPAPEPAWLQRLHPLVKIGWLVAVSVAVFLVGRAPYVLAVLGGLVALAQGAGGGLLARVRGRRLLAWSCLSLLLLQALFYRGATVLLYLWPWGGGHLPVTLEGLARGALVAGRFLVVVLSSQCFVLTTDPSDLAYALMRAGLPYRYGFALVTALRMVPVFEVEATTVYQAQLVRGVRYDGHALRRVIEILRQLLLPLLVSALRKVDALAISMEGRHFGRYPRRTFLRETRLTRTDRWAGLGAALFLAAAVCLRHFWG